MRILILILFILLFYVSNCQRLDLQGTIEKFEDEFENSYYPIWIGQLTYYLSKEDTVRFVQITYWSNTDIPIYPYINIIYYSIGFWISINPLKADIYNPTVQIGHTFQIFHPPRWRKLKIFIYN